MEKLKKLLSCLNADSKVKDIEDTFEEIADILLFKSYIQTDYGKYRLLEIEFYFKNKNHKDDVTIKRKEKEGMWWLHDYGVDLSFESDDSNYYGGILIRSMMLLNNDNPSEQKFFFGPKNCCWQLFYSSALEQNYAPRVVMNDDNTKFSGKMATTQRYITGKIPRENGDYRFYVEGLTDLEPSKIKPNYKKASPWKK